MSQLRTPLGRAVAAIAMIAVTAAGCARSLRTVQSPPIYPDILLSAGLEGEVRVRYTIDSTGHVAPGSLVVLNSSHELFKMAVKKAAAAWSFAPARMHGSAVTVEREEVFAFRLPPRVFSSYQDPKAIAYDTVQPRTVARDTIAGGIPRTTIGVAPRDPLAAKRFSRAELLAAQRAALVTAADIYTEKPADGRSVTLCVTMLRDTTSVPADAATLRALTVTGRRAVVERDCPRTYATMILLLDSLGQPQKNPVAPTGWIDPYRFVLMHAEGWSADVVRVWGQFGQGTGGHGFACRVRRERGVWSAVCERTYTWMS